MKKMLLTAAFASAALFGAVSFAQPGPGPEGENEGPRREQKERPEAPDRDFDRDFKRDFDRDQDRDFDRDGAREKCPFRSEKGAKDGCPCRSCQDCPRSPGFWRDGERPEFPPMMKDGKGPHRFDGDRDEFAGPARKGKGHGPRDRGPEAAPFGKMRMPFMDDEGRIEIKKVVRFLKMQDTNDDGFICPKERQEFFEKMMARHHDGERPEGNCPEGDRPERPQMKKDGKGPHRLYHSRSHPSVFMIS